jgi:dihydroneopterin aldolase
MNVGVQDGRSRRWRLPRIEIRDLRITATHGVLAEERERAQPFSLDLDVWVKEPAIDSVPVDDLSSTSDYAAVIEVAVKIVQGNSFKLLETCADAVARAILESDEKIKRVAVTMRKLRPPIPYDVASVGVRRIATR